MSQYKDPVSNVDDARLGSEQDDNGTHNIVDRLGERRNRAGQDRREDREAHLDGRRTWGDDFCVGGCGASWYLQTGTTNADLQRFKLLYTPYARTRSGERNDRIWPAPAGA